VDIPPYDFSRMEKVKVALVAATGAGLLRDGELVLCAVTRAETRNVDTLLKLRVGKSMEEQVPVESLKLPAQFNSQVVEAIVTLALAVGHQGFEGHPIGTIFVVGDSVHVMEMSRQLTINPFQGLPEAERNVLDPSISEAVKNFSVLDGAFVIREDGVVLAAGRYLQPPASENGGSVVLPLGLGARHAASATLSRATNALVVTVSQSTGMVRVFQGGEVVMELSQVTRRSGVV